MCDDRKWRQLWAKRAIASLVLHLISGICLVFLSQSPSFGNEIHFRNLSVDDGLSQNHIESIVQDREGYIWLGTANGLNRFDGYHVVSYLPSPEDSTSLGDALIQCLFTDSKGTVWIGMPGGLDRFDSGTESFSHWPGDPSQPNGLLGREVNTIAEDHQGFLWVGAGGLNRVDPISGSVVHYPLKMGPNSGVQVINEDTRGRLWVGLGGFQQPAGDQDGIYLFDRNSGSFVPISVKLSDPAADPTGPVSITSIAEDTRGQIWIGTWGNGLFRLDDDQGVFVGLSDQMDETKYIREIHPFTDERMWVVTFSESNWYVIDGQTDLWTFGTTDGTWGLQPTSVSAYAIHDLFFDRTGSLWLGTNGAGAFFGDALAGHFDHFKYERDDPLSLSSNFVRAVHADEDGTFWVGTLSGLDHIDRSGNTVQHFNHDPDDPESLAANRVKAIHRDAAGYLWVATADRGLSRLRLDGAGFDHYRHDPSDSLSISAEEVSVILENHEGFLWVGRTGGGLDRLDQDRRHFKRYMDFENPNWNTTTSLYEDAGGTLWVGTLEGLGRYDAALDSVICYGLDLAAPECLRSTSITAIAELPGQPGVLWLGTGSRGLVRFDVTNGSTERIDKKSHGLPDNTVYGVLADDNGQLWVSTQAGFARFDTENGTMKHFDVTRGLQSKEFNHNAFHKGPEGEMFFGGVGGLNSFFPEEMVDNPFPPQVVLDRIEILDRSKKGREVDTRLLLRPADLSGTTSLHPSQRDISFNFTALHFTNPEKNQYAYRLEGFDHDWQEAGVDRIARYTNLDHGDYSFRVKAASAHGVWSDQEAVWSFTINKPFWKEWWFLLLTAFFVLGLVAAWYSWKVRGHILRQESMELEIARRTNELEKALATVESHRIRLSEIDEAKSRFVANISHELRTPLTLVVNPLEDLRDGVFGDVSREALHELNVALRSVHRLKRMADQLLTVARLEAGELTLRVQQYDFVDFLRDLFLAFSPLAERKRIQMSSDLPTGPLPLWFDSDRMEEIITNLLSNALKFTPEGGTVLLSVSDDPAGDEVVVEVTDNGPGIPGEYLPHVFDRFYQVDEMTDVGRPGAGIGLCLAKEFVEIHGGKISVESVVGRGSSFFVRLRQGKSHFDEGVLAPEASPVRTPGGTVQTAIDDLAGLEGSKVLDLQEEADLPTVLVVDDNEDMRNLIRRYFIPQYRVIEAENGVVGLARARETMPDVIISDVMMPEMDGNAMCRAIKADPHLEFIPVILLTARSDISDKISGLEGGADDYQTKPFNAKELRARVENLIQLRHRLKTLMGERGPAESLNLPPDGQTESGVGLKELVQQAIDKNLSDEGFGVEALAACLGMSRVHLFRRVRDLFDQSPSELIMEARLQRGAQLLVEGAGTVSEVAYGVGFKSLSHFSTRFSGKFGQSPSAFRVRNN